MALRMILLIGFLCFYADWVVAQTNDGKIIIELKIDGAIGPATGDYIERVFESVDPASEALVIIRMDTPGGLDATMRDIIKQITSSPVPVATYVAPTGARAASAGTYILYASHIAAMAPGTNLGSATPVQIGGFPSSPAKKDRRATEESEDKTEKTIIGDGDAMQKKIINDAVAYIRGLAKLHGRNQEWAEQAVTEAVSLPAGEALELNVIDIVATDMTDLLKQINGREIKLNQQTVTIQTEGLERVVLEPDWRSRLLGVITSPNIAYILMLVGIYGLILEFTNPGAILPGTVGAISLLLALYAFQLLPINYAGVGLILLGLALIVGEAFQPSFGILGIGGLCAFIVGSIILMDTQAPGFGINLGLIIGTTVASALILVLIVGMALRARKRPAASGRDEMLGLEAIALADFNEEGRVQVHGETWHAQSRQPVRKNERLKVTAVQGLTLQVEPEHTNREEKQS